MNRGVSVGLLVLGVMSWYDPGFNGIWMEASDVSEGDGRIAAAIFIVGAAVVWFQRG